MGNIWSGVQIGYSELVEAIIRPPRAIYSIDSLGPKHFRIGKTSFSRNDLVLVNQRGLSLYCSHWEPLQRHAEKLSCLVYLHGNSSARFEALGVLPMLLSLGVTVFAFDCSGSGRSEGKYVSLGYYEREDLRTVIDHLRGSGTVMSLAVWGRSMGAVTGLMYQSLDIELRGQNAVDAMVLDSPFADFLELAEELANKTLGHGSMMPIIMSKLAIQLLKGSVESLAKFSLADLSPIRFANKCNVPALFFAARDDKFILASHAENIYERYGGTKSIAIVDGDHNSRRGDECLAIASSFLAKYMLLPSEAAGDALTSSYSSMLSSLPKIQYNSWVVGEHMSNKDRVNYLNGSHFLTTLKRYTAGSAVDFHRKERESGNGNRNNLCKMSNIGSGNTYKLAHYYCCRGNALEELGDMGGAIASYRRAILKMHSFADAHYNLASVLKTAGHLEESIIEYKLAIKYKSDYSDAYNNLGVCFEEKGEIELSVQCYRKAIKHKPDHAEAHCNLADVLQSIGCLEGAVQEYKIALRYKSKDADSLNNMGVALEAQNNIDAAIQAYTMAVAHQPEHWDAQCNLANALHNRGQLDTAIHLYSLILENKPDETSIHSSLGNALQAKGDFDGAIRSYRHALKTDKDGMVAGTAVQWNNLGTALQLKGRHREAAQSYKAAIALSPTYSMAHFNLGNVLQSIGSYIDAIASYEDVLRLDYENADALNNLGTIKQALKDIDGAIEAFKRAVYVKPNFKEARSNLAQALKFRKEIYGDGDEINPKTTQLNN